MSRDRWPELVALYATDDGLPVRKVGSWTEDKLYFWNRYIEITTKAMVGHPKWPAGVAYIDLFAGPGICELEGTGRRIPGSVLIAANAPKTFATILAAELDASYASSLEARLRHSPAAQVARVFTGDCNRCIAQMIQHVPPRALTLAFIDPERLNVDFQTVDKLSQCGQVDLLILFADRMDLVRNVDFYEKRNPSVLDRMMGPSSRWRDSWAALSNRSAENICRLFANEYRRQLQEILGYIVFREKVMTSPKGPLYRLIFASKHEKGAEFWDKITKKDRGGQFDMF